MPMTMFLGAFAGSLLAMIVVGFFLKSELRLCLTEMALSMKSDIQSYVNEQSKILATKEDIGALIVEGVAHPNANLAATISDRRSTWAAKKEMYERAMQYVTAARSLSENYSPLRVRIEQSRDIMFYAEGLPALSTRSRCAAASEFAGLAA